MSITNFQFNLILAGCAVGVKVFTPHKILTASSAASSFKSLRISGVDVIIMTSFGSNDVTSGSSAVVVDVLSVDNSTVGLDVGI